MTTFDLNEYLDACRNHRQIEVPIEVYHGQSNQKMGLHSFKDMGNSFDIIFSEQNHDIGIYTRPVGIHDQKTDMLYFYDKYFYKFCWFTEVGSLDKLDAEMQEKIDQKILDKMKPIPVSEPTDLDDHFAQEAFIKQEPIDEKHKFFFMLGMCMYYDYDNYASVEVELYADYLNDPDKTIDKLANDYYRIHSERLIKNRNEKINQKKLYDQYVEDPDIDLIKKRDAYKALEDKYDVKVLYEGLDKDGKPAKMIFHIGAEYVRSGLLGLDLWSNGIYGKDKINFNKWFKELINFDYFTKIYYKNRIIYNKADYEEALCRQ